MIILIKLTRLIIRSYWKAEYRIFRKKYKISDNFSFNGFNINLYGDGNIKLGNNSYCGNNCSFQASKGLTIEVGDNTAISHNVRIYTSNRSSQDIVNNKDVIGYRKGNVSIGNNCWIGANVFICEGVNIGNNVVIGANSVVTKDLDSYSINGGVPAKEISKVS
ncbi:DapH/DapD/GlmU-related protein [Vibrio gigantis]|uniref:acyltransferase n=1 Tax=Vibrio gigantis TaxID=296199 RepID=UPI0035A66F86